MDLLIDYIVIEFRSVRELKFHLCRDATIASEAQQTLDIFSGLPPFGGKDR